MSGESQLTPEAVRALAVAADLSLEPERAADIAERLAGWLEAANELSRKMSAPEHRQCVPVTNFTHPDPEVLE